MQNAPEVVDVRVAAQGIIVTFSDGKVGGYSAALLATLYAESKEIRNRRPSYGREDGLSPTRRSTPTYQ